MIAHITNYAKQKKRELFLILLGITVTSPMTGSHGCLFFKPHERDMVINSCADIKLMLFTKQIESTLFL